MSVHHIRHIQEIIVYECNKCYATLPYMNADHNCPEQENDEGFHEHEDYLQKFFTWLAMNQHRCRTLQNPLIHFVYKCYECKHLLPYPRCSHPCVSDENEDLGFEESPNELFNFVLWSKNKTECQDTIVMAVGPE